MTVLPSNPSSLQPLCRVVPRADESRLTSGMRSGFPEVSTIAAPSRVHGTPFVPASHGLRLDGFPVQTADETTEERSLDLSADEYFRREHLVASQLLEGLKALETSHSLLLGISQVGSRSDSQERDTKSDDGGLPQTLQERLLETFDHETPVPLRFLESHLKPGNELPPDGTAIGKVLRFLAATANRYHPPAEIRDRCGLGMTPVKHLICDLRRLFKPVGGYSLIRFDKKKEGYAIVTTPAPDQPGQATRRSPTALEASLKPGRRLPKRGTGPWKVLRFLMDHPGESFRASTIAQHSGVSPKPVLTMIRRINGLCRTETPLISRTARGFYGVMPPMDSRPPGDRGTKRKVRGTESPTL